MITDKTSIIVISKAIIFYLNQNWSLYNHIYDISNDFQLKFK